MTKKKVAISEEDSPNNIVCEIQNMPQKGEAMVKVEPHEPNKKTRKPLSQESLDKLALARQAAYKKRMELKAQREKPEPVQEVVKEPETPLPSPRKEKKTKSKSKKPIVIMEQSSSESDEEQQVIYVKKKSNKKKSVPAEEQVEQPPPPQLAPQPTAPGPPVPMNYHQPTPTMHQRYGYNPNFSQFSNRRRF